MNSLLPIHVFPSVSWFVSVFLRMENQETLISCATGTCRMTYGAKCFEGLFRHKGSIKAKEKYRCIGEHPSEDNEVVHIWTRHLYQPAKRDDTLNRTVTAVIPRANTSWMPTTCILLLRLKEREMEASYSSLPRPHPQACASY